MQPLPQPGPTLVQVGNVTANDAWVVTPVGTWPIADVNVTTDYRQVISEALIRRMANPNIYYVFPGYSGYTPLGVFQGADLPPGTFDEIFGDGFE